MRQIANEIISAASRVKVSKNGSESPPQNFHQPSTECVQCGGFGFYTLDVPRTHDHFGVAMACDCKQEDRRVARLEALNAISADVASDQTFDTFKVNRDGCTKQQLGMLHAAYVWCRTMARDPRRFTQAIPWLTLQGNYGAGKSHLGRAIWNYRQDPANGTNGAAFIVMPDLLEHIRQGYNDPDNDAHKRFEAIRTIDTVLILDDLGAESTTQWVEEKLFALFNWRYDHKLPTVVLTNANMRELEPRVADRLKDGVVIVLDAPSYRGKQNG